MLVQTKKAFSSIRFTLLGIYTSFNDWDHENAPSPIVTTEGEIVTEESFVQFPNVSLLIDVIPEGIVTFVKSAQKKAPSPIFVTGKITTL